MVAPMAQAAANSFTGWIFSQGEKKYKLWKNEKAECASLQREYDMLAATLKAAPRTDVAIVFNDEMRDLTHDIEDCMELFQRHVTCKEGESWFSMVWMILTRLQSATDIKKLKMRAGELRSRVINHPGDGQPSSAATAPPREPGPDYSVPELHGIEEPKKKILSLIKQEGAEPDKLRVIAVVGFGGSGKTALATRVFNEADKTLFGCRVFVRRREYEDASGLLKHIIRNFWPSSPQDVLQESDAEILRDYLKEHLERTRYLIVIDDIELEFWGIIKSTFQDNLRTGSTIMVTTTSQRVANSCCNHGKGYQHKMSTLGEAYAKNIALSKIPSCDWDLGSATLLKKCDGLPLALVSVDDKVGSVSDDRRTWRFCEELGCDLGYHLVRPEDNNERNFARLRGVLMDNYTSLSDHKVRTCLLYLGNFPNDRPLRRNVVIRRWLAEGYARGDDHRGSDLKVATEYFDTFIDGNMIQPVYKSNNTLEKTCKAHGIVHEFVLHKSIYDKFIMSFGDTSRTKVRHLSIHHENNTGNRTTKGKDLSRVRSLTVLGNAGDAISNFHQYKLIRVLDLEGCTDVNDGHLKGICKLLNLRYLSLGQYITKVPKEISHLELLETLDVSNTEVNVLPVEVIWLPCLTHLIGKFKLQGPAVTNQRLEKCKLETISGFVADGRLGFLQLMVHMKKLNKVKIWCEWDDFIMVIMNDQLLEAIKKYTEDGDARSLSIDFRALPERSLRALADLCDERLQSEETKYYYPSSLKLHGNSSTLSGFLCLFRGVSELCLSTTVTAELLSNMSGMLGLNYLKLTDHKMRNFTVQAEGFRSLLRLRLVFQDTDPTLPLITIREGALPELVSLQLICERLAGLSGIDISHLHKLKEIVLHPGVAVETRQAWKVAAWNHPNMPDVMTIGRFNGPAEAAPGQAGNQPHQAQAAPEPMAVQDAGDDLPSSNPSSLGLTGERRISVAPEETELVDAGNSTLQMTTSSDISSRTINYSTKIPAAVEKTVLVEGGSSTLLMETSSDISSRTINNSTEIPAALEETVLVEGGSSTLLMETSSDISSRTTSYSTEIPAAVEETVLVEGGSSTLQMETSSDISNPTTNYSTEIPVAP